MAVFSDVRDDVPVAADSAAFSTAGALPPHRPRSPVSQPDVQA